MPQTTCPACNAMVAFTSGHAVRKTICPKCEAVIAIGDVPTGKQDRPSTNIQEKTEAITTYRHCPFCGKQVESYYRYCPHCDGMFKELESEEPRHKVRDVALGRDRKYPVWTAPAAALGIMTVVMAALITAGVAAQTGSFVPLMAVVLGTGFVCLFAMTFVLSTASRRQESTAEIVGHTFYYSLVFIGVGLGLAFVLLLALILLLFVSCMAG